MDVVEGRGGIAHAQWKTAHYICQNNDAGCPRHRHNSAVEGHQQADADGGSRHGQRQHRDIIEERRQAIALFHDQIADQGAGYDADNGGPQTIDQ